MSNQKQEIIVEITEILKEMDLSGILLAKSNVEVLRAKERLDSAESDRMRKTG